MTHVTSHMVRVTFGGEELAGLQIDQAAASVRLLLPSPGAEGVVIPTWNGNEFLLGGGERPIIRTFTPLHLDRDRLQLDLDIVQHAGGAVSSWTESAGSGDEAAISGPGRGYDVDPDAPAFLLAGDETALPAIGQLIAVIPATIPVQVVAEITAPEAAMALPAHPALATSWVVRSAGREPGSALVPALERATLEEGTKVWVAGEAAAMQRIRRHFSDDRELPRSDVTVRGYWKHGR